MAWSPNSSRTPRKNKCGRSSSGAYQVLIQLWNEVAQRTLSGPLSSGVKPAERYVRVGERAADHRNHVVGRQGVGMEHADERARHFADPAIDLEGAAALVMLDHRQTQLAGERGGAVDAAAVDHQHFVGRWVECSE